MERESSELEWRICEIRIGDSSS